ncbi:Inner membrane transport permease YbhR [bacterium HR39]|nr:Inner membrane transport permease YbhR [bacterium HR39]
MAASGKRPPATDRASRPAQRRIRVRTVAAILRPGAGIGYPQTRSHPAARAALRGDVAPLYGALLVFALSVAGWGLAISAVAHTQQQAIVGVFLFVAPASILSGFAVPIGNMPDLLQWLTWANPLRYALVVIRGVFLRGLGSAELWGQIWPMAVIAAVSLTLAALVYRRRLG